MALGGLIKRAALGAVLATLCVAPAAQAEIRTITVQDPADATPTVSGIPSNPDIQQVIGTYDSAGTLTLTVGFYHPLGELDLSQNYKFFVNFDVGEGSPEYGDPGSCYPGGGPATLYGQHNILGSFYNRATVVGYDGYLYFNLSESPDKKWFSISASSPVLANRNYRCLRYTLYARSRSSISNLNSEYDAGCDCWYVSPALDTIRGEIYYGSSRAKGVWFDGFQPPPPTPPPPPVPAALKGRLEISARGGCRRATLNSWKVLPAAGGAPATGTIRAKLGAQVKEFPASRTAPLRWRRVDPGYRNIHVVYSGDARRTSAKADITVPVSGRGCGRR